MRPTDVKHIREAVAAARKFAHETDLQGCDIADIDELSDMLDNELKHPLPNPQKVTTYLDSLIRSLRSEHHSAKILPQLEDAMRSAGVHTGS